MKYWTAVVAAAALALVCWLPTTSQSPTVHVVVSDADSGRGTLREAIESANASDGDDLIRFQSSMTIRLRFGLPPLEDDGITIDGARDTGGEASPDIEPRVWLDGSAAGDAAGLEALGARSVIRGLRITGFERYGIGVIGAGANDARIEGNWIGLMPSGDVAANRLSGVAVLAGPRDVEIVGNRIGGNAGDERRGHGILIGGGGSVEALISDNVIGIGVDGSAAPNDDGILVVDSAQATIRDNTIGHSRVAGIELRESRLPMSIDGNRIGVDRDGDEAANDVGVFLGTGSVGARIGSERGNLIAGNRVGIAVEQGAREAFVERNWIGLVPNDRSRLLSDADLPSAKTLPNRERGISVIAGAAVILVSGNFVSAGEFGIVVAEPTTTQVSLLRNVVAGARSGPTVAAIDVRAGAEISIGGDIGFGNDVCGAQFGIRIAQTEGASIRANAVGAGAASRVTFDSDDQMFWGIRLGDGVVRARVSGNVVDGAAEAAISVVGDESQDNRLLDNRYGANGLDIDLGADGPDDNDVGDADRGPNGRLNWPTIESHDIRRVSDRQVTSTFQGTATPGSSVSIYLEGGQRSRHVAKSQPADRNGEWTAVTAEAPTGALRALATTSAGATSEFSDSFQAARRVRLNAGEQWMAWTGPDMPVAEAMSQLGLRLETVWRWDAEAQAWQGWSPWIPFLTADDPGVIDVIQAGDALWLKLGSGTSIEFIFPGGGI